MARNDVDYEIMLDKLDSSIDILQDKIENGRIKDPDKEKVRVRYHKELRQTIATRLEVVEQRDLQDMAETVEELKAERATA
jgi:hypothetical protein